MNKFEEKYSKIKYVIFLKISQIDYEENKKIKNYYRSRAHLIGDSFNTRSCNKRDKESFFFQRSIYNIHN